MASTASRSKRPFPSPEPDDEPPSKQQPKRWRFPKGKKQKSGAPGGVGLDADDLDGFLNPDHAKKERAKRRRQIREDEVLGAGAVNELEEQYADDAGFIDNGIKIEPFNLDKEKEEGYFDEDGNFVEYARENQIKDAWLDSVEFDRTVVANAKGAGAAAVEQTYSDLSSDDVGKLKRRIATILEPGETIIQALKRLKGTATGTRGKMSDATKSVFDELTEAAMLLMENGEYNIYHEEQETFQREAEGYERLLRARQPASSSSDHGILDIKNEEDIFSNDGDKDQKSSLWDFGPGPSATSVTTALQSSNDNDSSFDMFGADDEQPDGGQPADANSKGSSSNVGIIPHDQAQSLETGTNDESLNSDYVFDEASGYYYSSSLGSYYDPSSGFYCSASTGIWYSVDEQTGEYKEIQGEEKVDG